MPKALQTNLRLARRALPCSLLLIPLIASAQSESGSNSERGPAKSGSSRSETPSGNGSASEGTPLGKTGEPAAEPASEPFLLPSGAQTLTTTPSAYGASPQEANSSIGTPAFAAGPRYSPEPLMASPFSWGPFTARPRLGYTFTYATGVLVTPGAPSSTVLHSVHPGLTIASSHLVLDYTPTLNYYSKGPYADNIGHSARIAAAFGYNDWHFTISQAYNKTSQPLIETGTQTETESIPTLLGATWLLNEKVFFDFSLSQTFQSAQQFQNSRNWSTLDFVNYRLTQQLSIGVGAGLGYSDVDTGSDSVYEQIQGRVKWNPSRKLSVNLNGGIEIRQFTDIPNSENLINPLMGVGIHYQVFDVTGLFLAANRSVNTSIFANEINETTTVSGGINQRLLERLNLAVSAGYRTTDYRSIIALAANNQLNVNRSDDSTFVSTSIGTSFLKRGSLSFSYQHSKNESTLAGFTYDSDQFSASIGYHF